jgi:hypothetical protein
MQIVVDQLPKKKTSPEREFQLARRWLEVLVYSFRLSLSLRMGGGGSWKDEGKGTGRTEMGCR